MKMNIVKTIMVLPLISGISGAPLKAMAESTHANTLSIEKIQEVAGVSIAELKEAAINAGQKASSVVQDKKIREYELRFGINVLQFMKFDMEGVRWIADSENKAVGVVGRSALAVVGLSATAISAVPVIPAVISYIRGVIQFPIDYDFYSDSPSQSLGGATYRALKRGSALYGSSVPEDWPTLNRLRLYRLTNYVWRPTTELPKMPFIIESVVYPTNVVANVLWRSIAQSPKVAAALAVPAGIALVFGSAGYTMILNKSEYDKLVLTINQDINSMTQELNQLQSSNPSR